MVFGTVLSLTTTLSLSCIYNPEQCSNATSQAHPPPLIIYGPSAQTLLVHDIAILPCQVGGEDQPNITWYHNGERVAESSRVSQLLAGSLRITDLKKTDSGDYICQVESSLGTDRWSAHLQVEEHNNPNAVFDRMPDKSQLPSAPTKPRIKLLKGGAGGLELEWSAPEHTGESSITHYTVRYWSAINENPTTWTTVSDKITTTNYALSQPKAGATYFFVVRANNARGAGEPSPVSHFTYASSDPHDSSVNEHSSSSTSKNEALGSAKSVKLTSVYSINTTSALLTWTNPDGLQNDGFYLTWRGPPLDGGQSIMNITDPKATSAIIEGLRSFSSYDFFLIPYRRQNNLSPSNSMELLTPEGKPAPPRNVFARMENLTSVMIAFSPPAPNEVNGVLRGFDIRFVDNSSSYENTIRTKANARSITLKNMRPGNAYQAHIAAFNGAGRSDFVSTELFTMDEATLLRHQQLYGDSRRVGAAPAFWLGLGGGLLALTLFLLVALLWCKRWNGRKKPIGGRRGGCPPCDDFANIKINDGSVATMANRMTGGGSEEYWPDASIPPFHLSAAAHHAVAGNAHPMPQLSATSPRTPPPHHHFYAQHSCCAAAAAHNHHHHVVMNGYGTTVRHPQHYSGPYMSSSSTLNRAMVGVEDMHQYHYAVLPGTLPPHTTALMAYEDDPSPYASTTITSSNGYGPPIPSNPIPPPPAMFANHMHHAPPPSHHFPLSNGCLTQQSHFQTANGSNSGGSSGSIRRTTSGGGGRRTPRTNPHLFAQHSNERQVPAPAPSNGGDPELSKILGQVRPPPLSTYDSVTEDLAVPGFSDHADMIDEDGGRLPNRILNSRSPPRTTRSGDEPEERNLLRT